MDPVLVVGGGIAGIAAARAVQQAGLPVVVRDRGRRLGGRMASRTTEGRPVDTGASYFTAADPAFVAVVEDWQRRGLAREWTDTFAVYGDPDKSSTSGPVRWGAAGGLRSLVEDLATGLDVRSAATVERIDPGLTVEGQSYAAVVLAMPRPAGPAAARPRVRRGGRGARRPVRAGPGPDRGLAGAGVAASSTAAFVHGDPVLAWVADDGRRRGDDAPVLVAHSTADFAAGRLDDPDAAQEPMVDALRRRLEITAAPTYARVQRWSFARPTKQRDEPYLLGDDRLGVCGDGWHGKSRVEGAFLSGRALGQAIAERLS